MPLRCQIPVWGDFGPRSEAVPEYEAHDAISLTAELLLNFVFTIVINPIKPKREFQPNSRTWISYLESHHGCLDRDAFVLLGSVHNILLH